MNADMELKANVLNTQWLVNALVELDLNKPHLRIDELREWLAERNVIGRTATLVIDDYLAQIGSAYRVDVHNLMVCRQIRF